MYINMNADKKKLFSRMLLTTLVIGGVVLVAATNPYFGIKAMGVIQKELKKRKWRQFYDDLYNLRRRGFINVEQNSDGTYTVKTTKAGREQARKYDLDNLTIEIPKKWDKNWHLIVFDIPARKQKARLAFLDKLKGFGFVMLQRSIWAYPFECKKEISVLAKAFEIQGDVQYAVCHDVTMDNYLCHEFEKKNNIKLLTFTN